MLFPVIDDQHELVDRLKAFVRAQPFPCIGAKSALARQQMRVIVARDIASSWDDLRIYPTLLDFTAQYRADRKLFQTLAVVFEGPTTLSEAGFEHHLWERVQSLSDKDAWQGHSYDRRVSPDPADKHFSLSFGGEAFFVVGLHPRASRMARRFERPVMVFNLHDQFERLRSDGRYDRLRDTILERDLAYSGTANPMLAAHGKASEARQYSGRAVDPAWACPFHRS